ncbi:MAG TPA: glycosyltransferase family 39 protein, partial [Candidatus Eisenbacteria bacterium]|nr:glycosyltransferase family 39 protein [Candidatus Eisenbacteria bacterium]
MTRPEAPREGALADRWLIAILVLAALALRWHGIGYGLPEVYEEAYPFKIAWRMWGWGPDRAFDPNPHWFKYPGLTIELQLLGQALLFLALRIAGAIHSTVDFRILHELDPTAFYLTGRGITALLGAATVIPVFLLARRAAGRGAAIAAGLLVAVNPGLIAKSQVIEVDVPLTLLVAASLLAAVRLAERLTWGRIVAAGALVGLAAGAKYPGIVLAVPMVLAIVMAARRTPESRSRAPRSGKRGSAAPGRPNPALGAVSSISVFALVVIAALFVTSPYLFLDSGSAMRDLAVEGEHMRLGHFGADLGPTWLSYLRDWPLRVAGIPVAIASLSGLVWFTLRREKWAVILAGFVVAYAVLVSSFAMKADRYLLPLLPAAFVFAGALAADLCGRVRA